MSSYLLIRWGLMEVHWPTMWASVSTLVLHLLHDNVLCGIAWFRDTRSPVIPLLNRSAVRKPQGFRRSGLKSQALPNWSFSKERAPLPLDGNWLQSLNSAFFCCFLCASKHRKSEIGHCILTELASFSNRFSKAVSRRRLSTDGSNVFISVMPCFNVAVTDMVSSLGTPSPPSRLLQENRPLGVLVGRCRSSLTWTLIRESKPRIVEMGGAERDVICMKWG